VLEVDEDEGGGAGIEAEGFGGHGMLLRRVPESVGGVVRIGRRLYTSARDA
jgi:hypothetical protein